MYVKNTVWGENISRKVRHENIIKTLLEKYKVYFHVQEEKKKQNNESEWNICEILEFYD